MSETEHDPSESAVAALVDALPKAELHVHLEGTIEPETMLGLAHRNGVELPWRSVDELRLAYEFTSLQSFLDVYYAGTRVLVTGQDFYDLTAAYLQRAKAAGVVRAEMFFGPQSFLDRGIPIEAMAEGVFAAIDDANRSPEMSAALLISAQRHRSEAEAFELLDALAPWGDRVLGYGLGSSEIGNPPTKFQRFFEEARRQGFRLTAHAGEEGPASYVREAVEILGLSRIDHGVAAASDAALVAELVERAVTLTVCPVSNLKLKVVSSLADHPLPRLLRAGVRVTVNSDDPAYFGADMNQSLVRSVAPMRLGREAILTIVRNGFIGSFLEPAEVERHLAALDEVAARFPTPALAS